MHLTGLGIRVSYWVVLPSMLLVGFVLGVGVRQAWGAHQWGPVAAWLSGFVTVTAVIVALRQSRIAREDAAVQMDLAEGRHQAELSRAKTQLDAQRADQNRTEQVEAVRSLCRAIDRIVNDTHSEMARPQSKGLTLGNQSDIDAFIKRRRDWMSNINSSTQDAALSLIGLAHQEIFRYAQRALNAIDDLHDLIAGDLNVDLARQDIERVLTTMTDNRRIIVSFALLTFQPEYHKFIVSLAQPVENPAPTRTDPGADS